MRFFSLFRSFVPNRVARNKTLGAPRCRLALEILENRCLPSSLPSSISGYITNQYGSPAWGVEVDLYSAKGLVATTSTQDGVYSFTNLPAGTYTVTVPFITSPNVVHTFDATGAQVGTVKNHPDGLAYVSPWGGADISSITLTAKDSGINYDFSGYLT
jgi:hypothetical protein